MSELHCKSLSAKPCRDIGESSAFDEALMRKTAIFLSIIVLFLAGGASFGHAAPAAGGKEDLANVLWLPKELSGTPQDIGRRPNLSPLPKSPGEPRKFLPSLPEAEDGVIRRVRIDSGRKVAALTFDACELSSNSTGYDYRIVDFLRRERIAATFFMGGKWMQSHPDRTKQIMACPFFEVGNHAWNHGNFALMDSAMARDQILWTQAQYEILRDELAAKAALAGVSPALMDAVPEEMTFFRLPYGRSSAGALRLLGSLGLRAIQWDVVAEQPGDNADPKAAEQCAARVEPGSILLFHVNSVPQNSHLLVERVVGLLRARGYDLVTVSALLTMGLAERAKDGYFTIPGDNVDFDTKFGPYGTGRTERPAPSGR